VCGDSGIVRYSLKTVLAPLLAKVVAVVDSVRTLEQFETPCLPVSLYIKRGAYPFTI
jgi:hypothetical protein